MEKYFLRFIMVILIYLLIVTTVMLTKLAFEEWETSDRIKDRYKIMYEVKEGVTRSKE
jgi:hypothetical protein